MVAALEVEVIGELVGVGVELVLHGELVGAGDDRAVGTAGRRR